MATQRPEFVDFCEHVRGLVAERARNPLWYEIVDAWRRLRDALQMFSWTVRIWASLRLMELLRPREILVYDCTQYDPCPAISGGKCDCGGDEGGFQHWAGRVGWADVHIKVPVLGLIPPRAGYFWVWVLDIVTREVWEADASEDPCAQYNYDVFDIVVDEEKLTPAIIEREVSKWIARHLPRLSGIPVRFARYEEFWSK